MSISEYDSSPPESFSDEDGPLPSNSISNEKCSDSGDRLLKDPFVIRADKKNPGLCIVLGFDNLSTQYGDLFDYYTLLSTFKKLKFQTKSFYGYRKEKNMSTKDLIRKILKEIEDNDSQIHEYSCIVLFVLNSGSERDEPLTNLTEDILIFCNKYENRPKFIFMNVSQYSEECLDNLGDNSSFEHGLFVLYSLCPGNFFIRKLCNVFTKYSAFSELKAMVKFVIRSTKKNVSSTKDAPKIQICNLTRPVIFESRQNFASPTSCQGRVAIFNYDNDNKLDFEELEFVYSEIWKYQYITYKCLGYGDTVNKLEEEANKNEECGILVILIYTTCNDSKKFKTRKGYKIIVNEIVKIFETNNLSNNIQKYICINSINISDIENNGKFDYQFKQNGNVCISINTFPVNFAIQLMSTFNYPTQFSQLFPDSEDNAVDNIQQNRLLFDHFTNSTFDETSDKSTENKISQRFNEYFYKMDNSEEKDRVFGVKNIIGVILSHPDAKDQIEQIKQMQNNHKYPEIKFPLKGQNSITDVKNYFKYNKKDVSMPVDFLIFFIFAHCTFDGKIDEIKIGDGKHDKIKIDKLINFLCKDESEETLKERPKLIFIQNLSNEKVTKDFELQDDFLLIINPKNNQSEFINNFCHLLKTYSSDYDLLSILHKCNMMSKYRLTYIKSTLTKCLLLKSRNIQHQLDSLQSSNLFYGIDKNASQSCFIMKYRNFEDYHFIIKLKNTFSSFNHWQKVLTIDNIKLEKIISENIQSYFNENGFFAIIILDDTSKHDLIERLIEHLVCQETLFGKPKLLFLLGSLVTGQNGTSSKKNAYTKKMKHDFILPKHADIMLFHCEQVSQAIESISKIFVYDNITKYDLTNLLAMVSEDIVNSKTSENAPKEFVNNQTSNVKASVEDSNCSKDLTKHNAELGKSAFPKFAKYFDHVLMPVKYFLSKNEPSQLPALPYIHSTLTRLVSLQQSVAQVANAHFQLPTNTHTLPQENRGTCVIFGYEKFKDPQLEDRNGHQNDVQTMRKTFSMLGFEVKIIGEFDKKLIKLDEEQRRLNKSHSKQKEEPLNLRETQLETVKEKNEFIQKLLKQNKFLEEQIKLIEKRQPGSKQLSQLTKNQTMEEVRKIQCNGECLVVCFMTHGNDADELACYDGLIGRDDILNSIAQNKNLKGKLKIFLFQACRGESIAPTNICTGPFTDIVLKPNSTLTLHPDMFIFFSTFEGHKSIRNTDGSWFIQNLCKILRENYNRYDLFTIAALVCRAVSLEDLELQDMDKKNTYCLKAIPTFCTTFTRKISFALTKVIPLEGHKKLCAILKEIASQIELVSTVEIETIEHYQSEIVSEGVERITAYLVIKLSDPEEEIPSPYSNFVFVDVTVSNGVAKLNCIQ